MSTRLRVIPLAATALLVSHAWAAPFRSHPPMRPLPEVSARPLPEGPVIVVDAARGDDAAAGTEAAPFRTVARALRDREPGDTVCLRGGAYYEALTVSLAGTADKPITIRSWPGELAVLDGGFREFNDNPAAAWEPAPGGAPDEYRSTKAYPELAAPPDPRFPVITSGAHGANVLATGHFADSLVPLHGYVFRADLLSTNELWNVPKNTEAYPEGFYCGPGLWFNPETQRLHARFAHHRRPIYGEAGRYRGEPDPRRLPLLIGGRQVVLSLAGAQHVRIQDLALRGTRTRAVNLESCTNIVFDGVSIHGGSPALYARGTAGLTLVNCALRGVAAPWSSRSSMKYRGSSPYLLVADGAEPANRDFEFAHCEFTDSHDGLMIGAVDRLDFHHNLVDNFNDDGLYLTYGGRAGRGIRIRRNLIQRCLFAFSFAGEGVRQEGTEVYIHRNLLDLRGPVPYGLPATPESPQTLTSRGKPGGDHGSPIWKPMFLYHNTILLDEPQWRGHYGGLTRSTARTVRRLFNNIFYHTRGRPGLNLGPTAGVDLAADGNLHWSAEAGESFAADFLPNYHASPTFEASKALYPPGWAAHDRYADPLLVSVSTNWTVPTDVRLRAGSPARDAGVELPAAWPDAQRAGDSGKPDIGALPFGAPAWRVGVRGRIAVAPPD